MRILKMKNQYTLTSYIEDIFTNYKIEYTKKNFNAIRIKFERELKRLHKWDNAEQKLIGKKITRLFSYLDLKQVEVNSRDYLLKKSKIDKAEYLKHLDRYDFYMQNRDIVNDEINTAIEDSYNNYTPYVSEQEKINLMIEALFYKFFNGIDVELWQKDLDQVEFTDDSDTDNIVFFNASNRLKNKVKYYVIEKKD
jgi:putative uncharacterized protein orf8